MEKTPEQTAKAASSGSERARFSVPTLSVPTLSHGRISSSKTDSAHDPSTSAAAVTAKEIAVETATAVVEEAEPDVEAAAEPEPEPELEPEPALEPELETASPRASWTKRIGLAITLPKVALPKVSVPKFSLPKPPKLSPRSAKTAAVATVAVASATEPSAKKVTPGSALAKTVQKSSKVAPVEAPKKRTRSKPTSVLLVKGLTKRFDETIAVDGVNLEVMAGAFYGIVGPNGAGKTTTLSMITGLLRPDAGTVSVHGADVWSDPVVAKRNMGVLPDRLRLFDRLTGAQLLFYAGALRGMDSPTVRHRSADLANAFGLEDALGRLVSDYSAGMTKKIALAAAMIHSPRLLVLDEPFESVDPVSAATVTDILKKYAAEGGTVLLSSHSMDLVQRICDNVAVVVGGSILADGTMTAVRDGHTLEERFVELAGGRKTVEGLEWLHSFSD